VSYLHLPFLRNRCIVLDLWSVLSSGLRSQTHDDDDAGEAAVNDLNPDEIHVDDLRCNQPRR
jgi:hypothetical protein